MKRNPLLRSIMLTCVCLLAGPCTNRVLAQGPITEGQLLAVGAQGQPAGPCPLKHTNVKTEISGFLARVTVTQQFQNLFSDKIEAVYTFPLPQAAAVDDMTIVIGNRTVKGKIMRREEAQATYDAAKARGQTVALLNQQRPNIFTQAVANILPAQEIDVTISYVETLKYDEGSYEWHFPMVVGQRYIPRSDSRPEAADQDQSGRQQTDAPEVPAVPDAAQITPPVMPKGMRAGHDISIEINIDAGVPVVTVHSITHQIEAVQPAPGKASVHLKDLSTIPNKDFVLKYDVAGSQIEDALLFHRDGSKGYFTFILQPPQRVTVEDVTPKELVFVLDTSGSMSGFPIEKAKETMKLALDGLYPQDTFNVILFSGDTRILFPEPVPATRENLDKAKKLIASTKGDGGTEMMKAIRAALEPSDSPDHVRITCFMTDGQVGDDMNIIAEVQKHPRARVFAMGFSDAPNRFLLDKITEYGRGEVEYVTEKSDAKLAAKRFHERIRNPLLTDVAIDWNGLPVTDVYPKALPDLFSAKPVIFYGRYTGAAKGMLRLKGMMSGREYVREIPIEFPEQEPEHDVLGTLWARSKVDELMGQDMAGAQIAQMKDELKTEITNLGIAHRIMTQFTSFVAVDEQSPADGIQPGRVDVPVESTNQECISKGVGGVSCMVTVASDVGEMSASIDSTIRVRQITNLPMSGRSLQSLVLLAPGTVATRADPSSVEFAVSVNGQRATSNQITLDGVSANFGIAPGGQAPGASAGGNVPALSVMRDTSAIAPFSSIQEIQIHTSGATSEYGGNTGAFVNVVTKSGTNSFHGSGFEFFGNHAFDANDWFANSRGLGRPPSASNEFGGTFGGPIKRDRLFFFTSYEGLRLQQPVTSLTDVPSVAARAAAPLSLRPLLNLYPLPNAPARADGFAEFASAFNSQARHDVGALHIDFNANPRLMFSGHYNFADSSASERGLRNLSANTLAQFRNQSQAISGRIAFTPSPRLAGEIKINYSRLTACNSDLLDEFGGAILLSSQEFSQSSLALERGSLANDLNGHNTTLLTAASESNTQRQFNILGSVNLVSGTHAMNFGSDYRRIFPTIGLRPGETEVLFDGVSQALTGMAARVGMFGHQQNARPTFIDFAVYALDEWRVIPRLTFTYGLRWEINPAPAAGNQLLAVPTVNDPAQLRFAPNGSPLWSTTYGNFAPRASLAYQLNKAGTFMVRGSFGLLYDHANQAVGDAFAESYPSLQGGSVFYVPFSFSPLPISSSATVSVPLSVFDPQLKLPVSLQWSVSIEREVGNRQTISAAYVASANRRLLLTTTLVNSSSNFDLVRLTNNAGRSDYRSLQLQFKRRLAKGFSATGTYTWGKSVDNFSADSTSRALFRASDSRLERGPSDFDVRHTLTGFLLYDLPNPFAAGVGRVLARNWSIDSAFNVHSSQPVNVVYAVPTSFGFLYLRPDMNFGVPFYVSDPSVAGSRRLNANAFSIPNELRQGTSPRNAIRGFALAQFDLALRRQFNFSESARLIVGIQAANILNHPNFASPDGNELSLGTQFALTAFTSNQTFGQSFATAARGSAGTLGANYYPGGSRTLKLSARFEF